jgi:hypothetical protein
VAGTYHYESAGPSAGEGGSGGQPEVPAAGVGGTPGEQEPCVPKIWYIASQLVDQARCTFERNEASLFLLRWLSRYLPWQPPMGESSTFPPCSAELWVGMRTPVDDTTPLKVCDDWCTQISQEFLKERDRLYACSTGASMP